MLIAHGPLAVISSYFLQSREIDGLKKTDKFLILLIAFFLGILPDFDIFFAMTLHKSVFDHHNFFTHTPFFWITTGILLYIVLRYIFKEKGKGFALLLGKVYIFSTLSHIFADLLTGHIRLLFPFSNQFFTFFGNILPNNVFVGYIGNPVFGLEIVLISIFLFICFKMYLPKLTKIAVVLIPLTSIYFLFNIFIYTQTYQKDLYIKEMGRPIYDLDSDGLANTKDYDVNNNFTDNFHEINIEELREKIVDILKENPILLSKNVNMFEKVKYTYGGLDIQRVVFQAYQELRSPLAPVIWDYMHKNDIESPKEGLYTYLLSTDTFIDISRNNLPLSFVAIDFNFGPLLIIRGDTDNYSLGIILSQNNILYEDSNGNLITSTWNELIKLPTQGENIQLFIQYKDI